MGGTGNMIGQVRGPWGVPIQIDGSILFLLGFLLYMSLGGSLIDGAIFAAILLSAITLHELGHAWATQVQGLPVRRIVLHGGGGFCERGGSASCAQDRFIVAMGPLTNLALWAIAGVVGWALPHLFVALGLPVGRLFFEIAWAITLFGWVNLFFFAFNMMPVQPLDGGKLFHHAMLAVLPPRTAQRVTGGVGFALSILWIPAFLWLYLTWGFILFFMPNPKLHWRMMKGDLAF